MNNIGLTALVCLGAIYGAYQIEFHPIAVTIAALGLLAYAIFSAPSNRKPKRRLGWGD